MTLDEALKSFSDACDKQPIESFERNRLEREYEDWVLGRVLLDGCILAPRLCPLKRL